MCVRLGGTLLRRRLSSRASAHTQAPWAQGNGVTCLDCQRVVHDEVLMQQARVRVPAARGLRRRRPCAKSGQRTTFASSHPPFCRQLWRACPTLPPANARHCCVNPRTAAHRYAARASCTCAWKEARSASVVAGGMSCALRYVGCVAATCMASCVANCARSLRASPDTCAPSAHGRSAVCCAAMRTARTRTHRAPAAPPGCRCGLWRARGRRGRRSR